MLNLVFLIFMVFCFAIGSVVWVVKSKVKKVLFSIALIVYIIGFFMANSAVSNACTHGNCKHGWYSKNTGSQQTVAILWLLTPLALSFTLSDKDME